jgi:hypothetical protein
MHEVAALQPAARGRRPVADGEDSDSGVATINSRIVGVRRTIKNNRIIAASTLSHGEPHRPGLQRNDKNWLDHSRKTNLLECAVGIPARKKLIHTMPLKADRPINSRSSCRMRYFCHAQLFEITRAYKIKSPI